MLPSIQATPAEYPEPGNVRGRLTGIMTKQSTTTISDYRLSQMEELSRVLMKALAAAEEALTELLSQVYRITANHDLVHTMLSTSIPRLVYSIVDASVMASELFIQLTVQRRQLLMLHCQAAVDDYIQLLTASFLHQRQLCC